MQLNTALDPYEVTTEHIGQEARFYYQGNQEESIMRSGTIERVTEEVITLKIHASQYKSFSKSKIAIVFLF